MMRYIKPMAMCAMVFSVNDFGAAAPKSNSDAFIFVCQQEEDKAIVFDKVALYITNNNLQLNLMYKRTFSDGNIETKTTEYVSKKNSVRDGKLVIQYKNSLGKLISEKEILVNDLIDQNKLAEVFNFYYPDSSYAHDKEIRVYRYSSDDLMSVDEKKKQVTLKAIDSEKETILTDLVRVVQTELNKRKFFLVLERRTKDQQEQQSWREPYYKSSFEITSDYTLVIVNKYRDDGVPKEVTSSVKFDKVKDITIHYPKSADAKKGEITIKSASFSNKRTTESASFVPDTDVLQQSAPLVPVSSKSKRRSGPPKHVSSPNIQSFVMFQNDRGAVIGELVSDVSGNYTLTLENEKDKVIVSDTLSWSWDDDDNDDGVITLSREYENGPVLQRKKSLSVGYITVYGIEEGKGQALYSNSEQSIKFIYDQRVQNQQKKKLWGKFNRPQQQKSDESSPSSISGINPQYDQSNKPLSTDDAPNKGPDQKQSSDSESPLSTASSSTSDTSTLFLGLPSDNPYEKIKKDEIQVFGKEKVKVTRHFQNGNRESRFFFLKDRKPLKTIIFVVSKQWRSAIASFTRSNADLLIHTMPIVSANYTPYSFDIVYHNNNYLRKMWNWATRWVTGQPFYKLSEKRSSSFLCAYLSISPFSISPFSQGKKETLRIGRDEKRKGVVTLFVDQLSEETVQEQDQITILFENKNEVHQCTIPKGNIDYIGDFVIAKKQEEQQAPIKSQVAEYLVTLDKGEITKVQEVNSFPRIVDQGGDVHDNIPLRHSFIRSDGQQLKLMKDGFLNQVKGDEITYEVNSRRQSATLIINRYFRDGAEDTVSIPFETEEKQSITIQICDGKGKVVSRTIRDNERLDITYEDDGSLKKYNMKLHSASWLKWTMARIWGAVRLYPNVAKGETVD
ncbi:MAG: hypothetical protein WBQ73_03965 [Candidatus Babeliales bacterium]